jgi:MOSC domain-containing protein YiiM
MVRRFLASGRTGFYLAVQREGNLAAGDEITVLARDPHRVSIGDITRLYVEKTFSAADIAIARNAMDIVPLPDSWKAHFRQRLAIA